MVAVRGKGEVKRFIADIPGAVEKLLRGAGRAGATVIADEAKLRSISSEVTEAIKVAVTAKDGRIIAKVQVKGPGAYLAPWLEYGTDPHFISVDDSQRQGMSVRRINSQAKAGSLVIGGNFVGTTVFHPGATPHPFLRPALDMKEAEAVATAQNYINVRVGPSGISTSSDVGADQ